MGQTANITAILVAYNSADVISSALQSLCDSQEIAATLVVDNCSTDDTRERIKRDFPHVQILGNAKNEGFGRANNIALTQVQTPFALLLNPDAVLKEHCLARLLAAAGRYPDAAILAPVLHDKEGTMHLSYKNNVWEREGGHYSLSAEKEISGDLCAEFLSGAVWLMNMDHIKHVGFFDPNIFLYYEDDDLCLRIRKAGFGLVLVHDAYALHLMGASGGGYKREADFFRQRQMTFSRLYMEEKYRGLVAARKLSLKLNLQYSFKAAFCTLILNGRKVNRYRGRLHGVFDWTERQNALT